jgi:uncharacterized RDD family membrane protein YckC
MSCTPSHRRNWMRLFIALAALLAWSAAAAAQPPAESKTRRPRIVRTSTVIDSPASQDRPDEPVYRFYRPIFRLGQNFALGQGEVVREIQSYLADATVAGTVEGDVAVIVGSLRLTSTAKIGGSVVVIAGTLTIDEGASVGRDMVVVGSNLSAPTDFTPGGQQVVIGDVAIANAFRGLVPWITRGLLLGRLIVPDVRWIWTAVAVFFFIYLMLNVLFATPVRAVADTLSARPLSSFMLGLLVLVLTIPAIAILAATVIGLAVVPFVLCGIVVAALIGKVGVMRAIGRAVLPESAEEGRAFSILSMVIGFIVLTTAYVIPVLGFITWALTGVIGLGGAAAAFRAALRRERPARVREAEPAAFAASVAPQPAFAGAPAVVAPVSTFVPEPPPPIEEAPAEPTAPPPPREHLATDLSIYPRATFLDRVAAFALDAILVAIAVNLLDLTRQDGWFPLLLIAYHIAFWAWRGTTLGGIIIGLRVIRVQGNDLRFADALVRGLTSVFSIAALGIGCLWMLHDPEKQMWHDKIAGTLVVKVPRHLVLP